MRFRGCCAAAGVLALVATAADASDQFRKPSVDVGVHYSLLSLDTLRETDHGAGIRVSADLTRRVSVDAELNGFVRDFGGYQLFSGYRVQGLFGVKAGLRHGKAGVFGKVRPGFLYFGGPPSGLACIAVTIYPPPLECLYARGRTQFALDVGGVAEVYPWRHFVLRFDLGDTMIRYPGPVTTLRRRYDTGFTSHNLQFGAGAAFRF